MTTLLPHGILKIVDNQLQSSQQQVPKPIAPSPAQSPPPTSDSHKLLKWLLIGLVSAIVLLAGTYGYVLTTKNAAPTPTPTPIATKPTPTPDPTENWKTYTNALAGYLLKYPSDYKLMENQKSSVDGVVVNVPNTTTLISPVFQNIKTNAQISIRYENSTSSLTAQQFAQEKGITTQSNPYLLDGRSGFIFEDTPIGPYGSTFIYVFTKNKAYTITIETTTQYKNVKSNVDQILSTFKFLDQ